VQNTSIPTFAADGRRLRNYSPEAIERLLIRGMIVVRRNKRGRIICAQFREDNGANPLRQTAHMGSNYSFEEHCGDAYVWQHKPLMKPQTAARLMGEEVEDERIVDRYVRAIFQNVAISCAAHA
jgi:hypothetical protein